MEDWERSGLMVLDRLNLHHKSIETLTNLVGEIRREVAVIKTKMMLFSIIGSALVSGVVTIASTLLKG